MKTTVKFLFSTLVAAAAMTSTAYATTIYVDASYTAGTEDSAGTEGFGVTHFNTLEGAIAAAAGNSEISRIEICGDIDQKVESLGTTYNVAQSLVIGTANNVSYTATLSRESGATFSVYQMSGNSSVTIDKSLTIKGLDIVANGYATSGNNTYINGRIEALSLKQWTSNGEIVVGETGSVWLGYSDGQFDMAYGNGSMTVNGTLEEGTDLAALKDAQFKAGYSGTRGNGNTLNLNNTYFEAGAWFTINGSNGTFNLNNALLKVSGGDFAGSLSVSSSGNVINVTNGSLLEAGPITLGAGNTINIDGGKLKATTVTGDGVINVKGESTLNIGTLTGEEITFLDGAIIKDSTVGGGVFVAGNVTFRGQNTFAMLYDYGTLTDYYGTTAPMAWTVEKGASLVLTDKARYGLGYGDNVTVNGGLTDAKSARESLTEADCSLFMHGLVAQESKGWNCSSKFTVKDAYAVIGSNNSFGNKPGNYGGSYEFYFENSVLDASRITFYEALSKTTFTFKDCDVKLGTFMTRDKDSVFTLDNTKLLSTTTTNGNDEGNYNAGTLNVSNGSELTYSAEVKNEGGTINVIGSTFVAPKIENKGTFTVVGNSTVKFNTLTSAGEIIYLGKADGERSKISLGSVDGVATITYDKANQKSASVYAYNSDVSLSSDLIYDNNSGNYANAYLYFNNSTLDLGDGKTLTLKGGKLITRGLVITGKGTFVIEDSTHSPCWQESGNIIGKDVTLLSNTAANFYGDTTIYGTVNFALNTGNSDLVGSTYAGFEESATAKLTISGGNYTTKNGFVVTTKTNELNVVDAGTVLINKTLENNGVVTVGAGSTLTANAITGSGDVVLAGTINVVGGVFKADDLTIVAGVGATLNFGAVEKGVTLMATREVISFDFNTLTIVTDNAVVAGAEIQLDDIITGSGADEIWNALASKGESTEFTVIDSEGKKFTAVYKAGAEGSQGSISVIPEPSMFGLFAGLGALLLVGTRRRRR